MILEMLRWWYGPGWLQTAHRIHTWTNRMKRTFSVPLLARTLFAPWKRIVSISGRSLDDKIRALFDNFISRCVGFIVRILVLITAGVTILIACLAAIVLTAIWPLLPLAFAYFVIRSITG